MQYRALAAAAQLTINVVAGVTIVDPVAVANIEAALAAVPPDCKLHEPRENPREGRIECLRVDPLCHALDQLSAAVGSIARRAIRVVSAKPSQNAGPMQKIVYERIDDDEACSDLEPVRAAPTGAQQQ